MLRWLTKDVKLPEERQTSAETLEADTLEVLADLNHASQKVYKPSLIVQLVVQQSIIHSVVATKSHQRKLLYRNCQSTWRDNNCFCYGAGFNPYVAEWSPYHGAPMQ